LTKIFWRFLGGNEKPFAVFASLIGEMIAAIQNQSSAAKPNLQN
jgi:hypothetical protein